MRALLLLPLLVGHLSACSGSSSTTLDPQSSTGDAATGDGSAVEPEDAGGATDAASTADAVADDASPTANDGATDSSANDGATDASSSSDAAEDAATLACGVDEGQLGQACCSDATCSDQSMCLGETCSCVAAIHGDLYLRTDGRVVRQNLGFIEQGDTGLPLEGVTQIHDGHFHGCALRNDKTVWCWAKSTNGNGAGQLGNGTLGGTTTAWHATQVMVDANTPLTAVAQLNLGSSRCYIDATICAIKEDATVWCWGEGGNGVGSASPSIFTDYTFNKPYASQLMLNANSPLTAEQISVGIRHACALRGEQVWCWGVNVGGPLGAGDEVSRQYPYRVTLPGTPEPKVQKVGAGSDVSCVLAEGSVYCWGASGSGQVGFGDLPTPGECINHCQTTPVQVIDTSGAALAQVEDINVAYLAVCAERTDHTLWCWGLGAGNSAGRITTPGGTEPVGNVAMQTTCSSGNINQYIRYLTRDDQLYNAHILVNQVCGDTF